MTDARTPDAALLCECGHFAEDHTASSCEHCHCGGYITTADRRRQAMNTPDAARSLDDVLLSGATNLDGSQRFYPPYKHPATARLVAQKTKLEAFPESEDRDAALAWGTAQLAVFEKGEDRAKHDYLRMRRGR